MGTTIVRTTLAAVGVAVLTAWPGWATGLGVRTVPLAAATSAPVPVEIGVGRVALLDVSPYRVTIVATSDPTVAHAVVRDTAVLLVALRPGTTTVGVGLGGSLVASFRVTVTEQDTGVHAIHLDHGGVASSHTASSSTVSPASPSAGAQVPPASSRSPGGTAHTAGPSGGAERFVSTLSGTQRAALAAYVRDPSLDGLAALLRVLTSAQQTEFMRLVAGGPREMERAVGAGPIANRAAEQPPGQASGTPIQASDHAGTAAAQADVRVNAPEGVRLTVVPTWTGPVLSLSYVLQNNTGHTLRADPNAITVWGAAGDVTVRQLDVGQAGSVAPGGVETGVIVLTPASTHGVRVQWVLLADDGVARAVTISTQPR